MRPKQLQRFSHSASKLMFTRFSFRSLCRLIEDNKKKLEIAEYSVSQTTLEQIFNAFAKQQHVDSRDNP